MVSKSRSLIYRLVHWSTEQRSTEEWNNNHKTPLKMADKNIISFWKDFYKIKMWTKVIRGHTN